MKINVQKYKWMLLVSLILVGVLDEGLFLVVGVVNGEEFMKGVVPHIGII
jgi:hypothetical protein